MKVFTNNNVFLFLFFLIFITPLSWGVIQGSLHDFSARGWSNGEICLPCHTPHNALTPDAPLWNHQDTNAVFILYDSPTMRTSPESPRPMSKVCLSCHDGTVALDSFGGNIGSDSINANYLIDPDLSDDHPVSIYWSHQNDFFNSTCIKCHNPQPTDFNPILPLFDRYIECPTCHDPHNGAGYPKFLRKPLAGSEICLHCHGK